MRILFVYTNYRQIGGIETLIARLCRRLRALGHSITLLLQESSPSQCPDPALLDEVRRHAEVKFVRGWFRAAPRSLIALGLGEFDIIYAFESNSLLLGLVIQREIDPGARIAVGVYHPREYCAQGKTKRFQQRLVEDVLKAVPVENVVFMNEDSAREHGDSLGRDFGESPVIPLAIDLERFRSVRRCVNRRKIVSIGRIIDFKTYNFWMLDVIRRLNANTDRFEYHIYGTGGRFDTVATMIAEKGLERSVFLHGDLPYAQFGEALSDAFLFVGMGTAVLEAAACGVPALLAIESCPEPLTYGFLPEAKGYNAGEDSPDTERFPVIEKIEALAALEPDCYETCCAASIRSASKFSIETVADQFVQALNRTKNFSYPITATMRLQDEWDLWKWRLLRLAGFEDPLTRRYVRSAGENS